MLELLCAREQHLRLDLLERIHEEKQAIEPDWIRPLRDLLIDSLSGDPCHAIRLWTLKVLCKRWDLFSWSPPVVGRLFHKLETLLYVEPEHLVRVAIITLLHECAQRHPQERATYVGHFTAVRHRDLSMLIAALLILGSAIGDPSKFVRAHACTLIGTLSQNMYPDNSADDDNARHQTLTTVLCALLAKEAPTLSNDSVELPWSYCGSFVVALEDEFEMVRLAAIGAIRRLATASFAFASASTDFLLDTFQDESLAVKIAALQALRAVYEHHRMPASQAQLEGILAHQDDNDKRSRQAARDLLSSLRLTDGEGLARVVKCLASALSKYPDEVTAYALSLCQLAARNAALIAEYASSHLLYADRYFLVVEPKIEDYSYQVRLLLVLGALPAQPTMINFLPSFVRHHYHFARLKYPLAVPLLQGHPQLHALLYKCPSISSAPTPDAVVEVLRLTFLTEAFPLALQTGKDRERLRAMLIYNIFRFAPDYHNLLMDLLTLDTDATLEHRSRLLLPYVSLDEGLREAVVSKLSVPLPYTDRLIRIRGTISLLGKGTGPGGAFLISPSIPLQIPILGHVSRDQEQIEGKIYFIKAEFSATLLSLCEIGILWTRMQRDGTAMEKEGILRFQQILSVPPSFLFSEASPIIAAQVATVSLCIGESPIETEHCCVLDSFTMLLEPLPTPCLS